MKVFIVLFFISFQAFLVLSGGPKVDEPTEPLPPSVTEVPTESPQTEPETEAPATAQPEPEPSPEAPVPSPRLDCSFQTRIGNKIACAVHDGQTADDASIRCQARSGKLFVIESEEEKDLLKQWVNNVWAGSIRNWLIYRINGKNSFGQWVTSNGQQLPSVANPDQDNGNCLLLAGDNWKNSFLVKSNDCETEWSYICEIEA